MLLIKAGVKLQNQSKNRRKKKKEAKIFKCFSHTLFFGFYHLHWLFWIVLLMFQFDNNLKSVKKNKEQQINRYERLGDCPWGES